MKATALMVYDNTTGANFKQWAWGQGTFPSPTSYGLSTFMSAAGFIQTGQTSTFGGTLERSNVIGDGQTIWNNTTFTITATQSNASTATYTFTTLAGGPLRAGQYLASISGTTNGGGTFNVTIPTQVVVIQSVTYTSSTTGSFTTAFLSGTFGSQGEAGTGQVTANATSFFNTSTTTLPANNSAIGTTNNAAYQTTFKGYWQNGTSYSVGDSVIWVSAGTGTGATIGNFVCISATSSVSPPTTNTPNANWQQYNYEIWQTADSALPAYVQSAQMTASVAFSPIAYSSPNTLGNTLIAYGRFSGGSGAPAIVDTQGNSWVQLFSVANGSDQNVAWAAYNCKAGANNVTFSQPTQSGLQAIIAEYSGVTTVSPLDQTTSSTGTSTSASSGNVTTTVANELILGFVSNSTTNGLTVTAGSGFTGRQTVNGNTFLEDKDITTTQTLAATATLSSSVPWFAAIVTLKGTQLPTYYFKWEFGNRSTSCPAIGFQVGTAITATGSLSTSGLRGFREVITPTQTTAQGATQFETDFYADSTPSLAGGKFAMFMWRTANANTSQVNFGWERSKDNFGVDTPLYITYLYSVSTASAWVQSSVFATGGTNFGTRTTTNTFTIFMGNSVSLQVGNNIPVAPCFPNVGYFGNPLTIFVGLANQDTNEGVAFAATVYGATHTYLMSKVASAANYFGSAAQSGMGMRWE
jgi:hypothetical protein